MATLSPTEIQYQLSHSKDNRTKSVVVSHIICLSLAFIAVACRLLSRRVSKAAILKDDLMCVVALVSDRFGRLKGWNRRPGANEASHNARYSLLERRREVCCVCGQFHLCHGVRIAR